jgi:hypothetical protein
MIVWILLTAAVLSAFGLGYYAGQMRGFDQAMDIADDIRKDVAVAVRLCKETRKQIDAVAADIEAPDPADWWKNQ